MTKKYDVLIIGGGPSGCFSAYKINELKPLAKVLVLEMGKSLKDRKCPERELGKCVKCKICAVTHGSSGAGAFSDAKLLLPNKEDRVVRGNLGRHMTLKVARELYAYTDRVYLELGATSKVWGEDGAEFLRRLAPDLAQAGLKANCSRIRHLGTDGARKIYQNMEDHLVSHGVEIRFDTEVTDLIVRDGTVKGVTTSNGKVLADKVVLAIGRAGTQWLEKMCKKHDISSYTGPADIGVRYELPDSVMAEINENLYEGKFIGRPAPFRDKVRTFCQNPSGVVSAESYDGEYTLVNGHSYQNPMSETTNMAILASMLDGIQNPTEYALKIASILNALGIGQPLVQRYGDLKEGHRTTREKLERNSVEATLKSAIPGDISLGLPHRVVMDILGFIDQMDIIVPGFAGEDNLLYAPEIKLYSRMLKLSKNCETTVKGLYGIGDGAGPTHGLMPASVNGVFLGSYLASII